MTLRTFLPVAVLALLIAGQFGTAFAQQDPHAMHTNIGWVPREILERPLPLREGVGAVHEVVTTSSKDAQDFYDQGVAYLHSYVWIEAARSFNQALRIDPKLMLAYIGLSRVYSNLNDDKAARAALAQAQALAANATERERRRITIRAKQLDAIADPTSREKHLDYKKAIDEALAADMNDVELWLLRGNAEESVASGRGQRGGAASIAFYEAALLRSPDNFAAHHYLIHSYETIGRVEEALKHGEAYARLAYSIPHAHHMYGHDLRRVGRIEEAIERFQKADDLENAYYSTQKIPRDYDWHHAHNLDLLATCYQYQGQMKTAERLLREAASMPAMTAGQEFYTKEVVEFLLNRSRNDEALKAAQALTKGKWPMGRAVGHALAGSALLAMDRLQEAKSELVIAENDLQTLVGPGFGRDAVAPYVDELRGEILLRSGRTVEGVTILKDWERAIRAVPGPDAWILALFRLESIARVARDVGEWELAEYTARQMLEHDRSYAGSHFAWALVAEHKGDLETKRTEFSAAEKLWAKADADLPELRQIRAKLALKQ
jgi:tetratricopeptide (TPR) repeat protein